MIEAKTQLLARTGQAAEETGEAVIGIDDRAAVYRQRLIQRTLGFGHAFNTAHPRKMRRRNERDEADIGPRDGSQIGYVARLAGTHLEDGVLGVFRHRQQAQWQAQLVVVVAGADMRAAMPGQDRGDQRLHRGLTVGAGDANHAHVALSTHCTGQIAQRQRTVIDHDLRQYAVDLVCHQRRHRTTLGRFGQIIVTIHPFAPDRDEQVAGLQLAGIDRNTGNLGIGAEQLPVGPHGDGAQRHHARGSRLIRSSAACATARSSNGRLPVAPSW